MESGKKIVIVDDDLEVASYLETFLTLDGHIVTHAYDGADGVRKVKQIKPDLVLLDVEMPVKDGFTVCRELRDDIETRFIPIIMLTGSKTQPRDRITGLKLGADDYLPKPFDAEELKVRIERLVQRTTERLSAHPLTHLPGSISIEEEATRRISSGVKFAVCYFDLDNFKVFNDQYGYLRGDQAIQLLSQIITNVSRTTGDPTDFIGHIGGDDFILITIPEKVQPVCQKIVSLFDEKIIYYYDKDAQERKSILARDRLGNIQNFPLMTVTIAVVTNETRAITHYGRLVDILSELKKFAKSMKERHGSVYVKDRRNDTTENIFYWRQERSSQVQMKKSIEDLDLTGGKRVLVRVDYNVPLDGTGKITDDKRIRETIPTLKYLISKGARSVLISHLGRPKGKPDPKYSLNPVVTRLSELLNQPVSFASNCVGDETTRKVAGLKPGEVILLENLRYHPEEEKNDLNFARSLASYGDVFVQEAFGSVHRAHASTSAVAQILPAVSGYLLKKEIEFLSKALTSPERPFLAILGGAKVSDKISVILNLLDKVNTIIIGGAMAYTFLKAQGIDVGDSLIEQDKLEVTKEINHKAIEKKVTILLPLDHIVTDKIDGTGKFEQTKGVDIPAGVKGVDIGSMSIIRYATVIKSSRLIVWNGPLGIFEVDRFSRGTISIAQMVAEATDKGTTSIVGGGDTAAAVEKAGVAAKISHISTGGGASLEFLEGKTLPGIAVLQDK